MDNIPFLCFSIVLHFLLKNTNGLVCYQCSRSSTNEECTSEGTTLCSSNQGSCETEIRIENGVFFLEKRCKQTLACNNNALGNTINCLLTQTNPFCFYCCTSNHCNLDLPSSPLVVTEAPTEDTTTSSETTTYVGTSATTESIIAINSSVSPTPTSFTSTDENDVNTETSGSTSTKSNSDTGCQSDLTGDGAIVQEDLSTSDVLIILGIISLSIFGAIQCCFMVVMAIRRAKRRKEKQMKSLAQQEEDVEKSATESEDKTNNEQNGVKHAEINEENHMNVNGEPVLVESRPTSHQMNGSLIIKQESVISNSDRARLINVTPTSDDGHIDTVHDGKDDVIRDVGSSIDPTRKGTTKVNGVISQPPARHTFIKANGRVAPKQPQKTGTKLKKLLNKK